MAGNPTPVFQDDQSVSKAKARTHLPHRVGAVSDVRATDFQGVYRIYVSENRRNYDFIPSDATSPDDGFTVIVGPNGERWKHVDIDGSGGGAFDVVVPNIAARAAYDDEKEGFLVLVESDSGHSNDPWGYAKDSDASGDWTAGFPIRGPAVSDGDKGDIVVSGSGATWTIDEAALGKVSAEESVASAGTLNLTSTKARVLITGTTITTAITLGNNQRRVARVQDGWMCNVPGVLVRWLPPGSIVVFESDGSGNVRVVQRAFTIGNVSHIEAEDPWPSVPYKPSVFAKWSAKPWLDDGWYYSNASGNRSYYDSKGIIRYAGVNEPAFDTIYATGERGLQYFGARTNYLIRSQEIGTGWSLTGCSISDNNAVAPDGASTADSIVENSSTGEHRVSQTATLTVAQIVTLSLFVKPGSGARSVRLLFADNSNIGNNISATFDPVTGAIVVAATALGAATNASASVEALPDGWFRFSIRGQANTSGTAIQVRINMVNIAASYTGDGSSSLHVWGAQLEVGSVASPYIPTAGSQVTRAADAIYRNLSADLVNQNEMTVHVRGAWRHNVPAGGTEVIAALGNSSAVFGDDVYMARRDTAIVIYPAVSPVNVNSAVAITPKSAKVIARLKPNDTIIYANNNAGGQDTSCAVPANINRFTLGRAPWAGGGVEMNGNIMEAALWSRGLPDATLQAIST